MTETGFAPGDFAGRRCLRLLARESRWQGWCESEAVALMLETDDGRWHGFSVDPKARRWRSETLAGAPAEHLDGDDAEARHPLCDVGARHGTNGKRVFRITSRVLEDLAELCIEFDDGTALVAHHREPGRTSLTYTLPH